MGRIGKAILIIVAILGGCAACGPSATPNPTPATTPSQEDGKALLQQKLDRILVPPFSIDSFVKTGGQSKSESGAETFEMDFTAVVKYPGDDIKCVFPYCPQLSTSDLQAVFDKGKKSIAIKGRLTFEKTPNGWTGQL